MTDHLSRHHRAETGHLIMACSCVETDVLVPVVSFHRVFREGICHKLLHILCCIQAHITCAFIFAEFQGCTGIRQVIDCHNHQEISNTAVQMLLPL